MADRFELFDSDSNTRDIVLVRFAFIFFNLASKTFKKNYINEQWFKNWKMELDSGKLNIWSVGRQFVIFKLKIASGKPAHRFSIATFSLI